MNDDTNQRAREALAAAWERANRPDIALQLRKWLETGELSDCSDVALDAMIAFATSAREEALREAAEKLHEEGEWRAACITLSLITGGGERG